MKFSNNYIFYPDNKVLEQAISHGKTLLSEQIEDDAPTADITVRDNFIHTRGNFEQHRFSLNLLTPIRDAIESVFKDGVSEEGSIEQGELFHTYGNILAALAQQTQDVVLYEKAIGALERAFEIFTQEDSPNEWAFSQYSLGSCYQSLGRLTSDSKRLNSAVDAYTNALLVFTRDTHPYEWSSTMFQLGSSFHAYGNVLKGNRNYEKGVVAFKNALLTLDADNHALELAATHNSRGAILDHLGQSENNPERVEAGIRAYQTGLTVCLEQQLPFHLAVMCRVNIATAKTTVAMMKKDVALADEAADDFEIITEAFEDACQPLCLKFCQDKLKELRDIQW